MTGVQSLRVHIFNCKIALMGENLHGMHSDCLRGCDSGLFCGLTMRAQAPSDLQMLLFIVDLDKISFKCNKLS